MRRVRDCAHLFSLLRVSTRPALPRLGWLDPRGRRLETRKPAGALRGPGSRASGASGALLGRERSTVVWRLICSRPSPWRTKQDPLCRSALLLADHLAGQPISHQRPYLEPSMISWLLIALGASPPKLDRSAVVLIDSQSRPSEAITLDYRVTVFCWRPPGTSSFVSGQAAICISGKQQVL